MSLVIKDDTNAVLAVDEIKSNYENLDSPVLIEQDHVLEYEFAKANFKEMCFDGILLGYGSVNTQANIQVEASELDPMIGLMFILNGEVTASIREPSRKLHFKNYQHNIIYNPHNEDHVNLIQQPELQVFGVAFTKKKFLEMAVGNGRVLEQHAEIIDKNQLLLLDRNQVVTYKMMEIINSIKHCNYKDGLKKLFLQSKALELLALQCEQIEQHSLPQDPVLRLSPQDIEKIYFVRDIIINHVQTPLSLVDLSRLAGLNEFKLKKGFKQVFGNTVFGYLHDYRLEMAQDWVRDPSKSLTGIADELGFSSIQHFSNAFRKKFGLSPRQMR
ncbi:hypothetical protein COR50_20820 [Chitinophaga caeni]|uniref:HTH araC/xylS-type domain-containing protein n=1 Tax=Chitinophaga caeni TaxID=2029983 RepID=A0A291QZV5_9BACT|nr:AraC family transcriptional regulator [Chitinophaga caeni]ATL49422.1 hypothetical protein COR50_20820 [Chitinophaga caeni]